MDSKTFCRAQISMTTTSHLPVGKLSWHQRLSVPHARAYWALMRITNILCFYFAGVFLIKRSGKEWITIYKRSAFEPIFVHWKWPSRMTLGKMSPVTLSHSLVTTTSLFNKNLLLGNYSHVSITYNLISSKLYLALEKEYLTVAFGALWNQWWWSLGREVATGKFSGPQESYYFVSFWNLTPMASQDSPIREITLYELWLRGGVGGGRWLSMIQSRLHWMRRLDCWDSGRGASDYIPSPFYK